MYSAATLNKTRLKTINYVIATLCTILLVSFDVSAKNPLLENSFSVNVGAFSQTADIKFRSTKPPNKPIGINIDDLNIDDNYLSPYLEARWQFSNRWSVTTSIYRFSENGSNINKIEFNFDDTIFSIGARLDSYFTVNTYATDFGYSWLVDDNQRHEIGFGIHAFDLSAGINGYELIGDVQGHRLEETEDFLAPLPNIRFMGNLALSDDWYFSYNLGWLSASSGDWSGELIIAETKAKYSIDTDWSIGFGYKYTKVDVERETSYKEEAYDVVFRGPTLFFGYEF